MILMNWETSVARLAGWPGVATQKRRYLNWNALIWWWEARDIKIWKEGVSGRRNNLNKSLRWVQQNRWCSASIPFLGPGACSLAVNAGWCLLTNVVAPSWKRMPAIVSFLRGGPQLVTDGQSGTRCWPCCRWGCGVTWLQWVSSETAVRLCPSHFLFSFPLSLLVLSWNTSLNKPHAPESPSQALLWGNPIQNNEKEPSVMGGQRRRPLWLKHREQGRWC